MMICPNCKKEISAEAEFCPECGTKTEKKADKKPDSVHTSAIAKKYTKEMMQTNIGKRMSRGVFFKKIAIYVIAAVVLGVLVMAAGKGPMANFAAAAFSALVIAFMINGLPACIKRLHDTGKSGIYMVLLLVSPVLAYGAIVALGNMFPNGIGNGIGARVLLRVILLIACLPVFYLIYLLCKKGDPGENQYGPNPE